MALSFIDFGQVHRVEASDIEWSEYISESFVESGLMPRVLRSAPSGLAWIIFIDKCLKRWSLGCVIHHTSHTSNRLPD